MYINQFLPYTYYLPKTGEFDYNSLEHTSGYSSEFVPIGKTYIISPINKGSSQDASVKRGMNIGN